MNYLFYGKDAGRIQKEIQKVTKEYKNSDVITFDLNQVKFGEVMQELTTLPFFSDHKIIIMKNCNFLKDHSMEIDLTFLEDYLKKPLLENTLIMTGDFDKCDARKKIVKLVNQTCRVKALSVLDEKDKKSYVMEKCREYKLQASVQSYNKLAERLPFDTGIIDHELEKLSLYPGEINDEIIEQMIQRPLEENVFLLSEYILKGQFKSAFRIYKDLRSSNHDPIYLLAVLASQFRFYYQVKVCRMQGMSEENIVSYLKAHPYRVKLTVRLISSVHVNQIMTILKRIEISDREIKSGKKEKYLSFEMFLLDVMEEVR